MSADLSIQERLLEMQDEGYRDFHSKLIPNIDPARVIGVRTPQLRAYAKELHETDAAQTFLSELPHKYYEENNLHAFLIGQMRQPARVFSHLELFLPHIDNWATCDALRPKVFKRCRPELLTHIFIWLESEHTYTVRFALEMLMIHFLDESFEPSFLELAAAVQEEDYYVRMMVAWYFATALAEQYESAVPYLEERRLERWTHNKTIQKAIESYRITPEQKSFLRTLRY